MGGAITSVLPKKSKGLTNARQNSFLQAMLKYARLVKIEHTLFSLPLVYAGAFLAKGFSISLKEYLLIFLSPFPLAIFVVYPYMKRFTPLAHFGLGAASACTPLGGWMAVTGSFSGCGPSILLGLFSFFLVSGFDIIYAVGDEDFDRKQNLHSLVVSLGKSKALLVSSLLHLLGFGSLGALMLWQFPNIWSAALLAAVGLLLIWQQRVVENVELAFFKIN